MNNVCVQMKKIALNGYFLLKSWIHWVNATDKSGKLSNMTPIQYLNTGKTEKKRII